jgi:hypothetical protein
MSEDQLERLHEAYGCAVHVLVTGQGVVRERLREALAWLEPYRPLCHDVPDDDFQRKATKHLPLILGVADRLDVMTDGQLEDLAHDVWAGQQTINDAFVERAHAEDLEFLLDDEESASDEESQPGEPPPVPDAVTG